MINDKISIAPGGATMRKKIFLKELKFFVFKILSFYQKWGKSELVGSNRSWNFLKLLNTWNFPRRCYLHNSLKWQKTRQLYWCSFWYYIGSRKIGNSSFRIKYVKILGISKLESGTGEKQADAIYNTLEFWNVTDNVRTMCFETTASDNGPQRGADFRLEARLDRSLTTLFYLQRSCLWITAG